MMALRIPCISSVVRPWVWAMLVLLLFVPACGDDSQPQENDGDNSADLDLPGNADSDVHVADRDESPEIEEETGDTDEEQDSTETVEMEPDLPEDLCGNKDGCPDGEWCYWKENRCKDACDPENPDCSAGEACMLLQDDWYGGEGKGICIPMDYTGKKEAYACNNATPCQTHLICLESSCHRICDPDGVGVTCDTGQSCDFNSELGVGVCGFCTAGEDNCPAGYECIGGVCVESSNCDEEEDCVEGKHCDLVEGTCGRSCDPEASQCPSGLICAPLLDDPFPAEGEGVCTVASGGGAFGALCDEANPCERTLICLSGHCFAPCDLTAETSSCPDGILCTEDAAFAYGLCRFCDPQVEPSSCPDDTTCLDGYCLETASCEATCEDGTTCYPPYNVCRPDCDPLAPNVDEGFVCGIITEGDDAGKGVEVVARPDLPGVGDTCGPIIPCQPQLLCFENVCRPLCDPQSSNTGCDASITCGPHEDVPVSICRPCGDASPCPEGSYCEEGICLDGWVCDIRDDCPESTQICLYGFCEEGCHDENTCPQGGTCADDGGCSYGNCSPACADGECCNVGECGPCCEQNCPPGTKCQYGVACSPASHCCLPFDDCRDHEDDWCAPGTACNTETGLCYEACPTSCPFGYHCDESTDLRCYPYPPETCSILGGDACDTPCLQCKFDFLNGDWCEIQPNTSECTPSCLAQGVMYDRNGYFSCCEGLTLCDDTATGRQVCCLPDHCNYNGCEVVIGEEEDPPCECDTATGAFCTDPSSMEECNVDVESLHIQWQSENECMVEIYDGDPLAEGELLATKQGCDDEPIAFLPPGGSLYEDCVLFWSAEENAYRVNCSHGDTGCSVLYTVETCFPVDGDEEIDTVEWNETEESEADTVEIEENEQSETDAEIVDSESEFSDDENESPEIEEEAL